MDLAEDDWRKEIVDYLEDPSRKSLGNSGTKP
jgi:hypothetical protein